MLKKNHVLLVIAALVMTSAAMASSPLGAPVAELRQGQMSVGVDYGYTEHSLVGILGRPESIFRTNAFLANLGYGVADNVEVYALLGMIDGSRPAAGFDASYDFAYGFGTKVTLADQGEIKWGLVTQMLWAELDDTLSPQLGGAKEDIDLYELKVAAGPAYTAMEGLQIYGGPMLHVVNANYEVGSPDYNDREVGFFAGAQYEIMDNMSLLGEWQWTCDMDMVGISVGFKF